MRCQRRPTIADTEGEPVGSTVCRSALHDLLKLLVELPHGGLVLLKEEQPEVNCQWVGLIVDLREDVCERSALEGGLYTRLDSGVA